MNLTLFFAYLTVSIVFGVLVRLRPPTYREMVTSIFTRFMLGTVVLFFPSHINAWLLAALLVSEAGRLIEAGVGWLWTKYAVMREADKWLQSPHGAVIRREI